MVEQILRRVDEFKALVDPTVSLAQVALRFCLSHPAVTTVIPGVRNAEQARCNLGVLGQDALPQAVLSQIERCWQEEWHRQVRTSIGGEGEQRAQAAQQTTGSRS